MKTIKTTIAILFVLSFSISCNKDDDATPTPLVANPEVNPLPAYLIATGFSEKTTNQINLNDYEFGLSFKPIVNGKITALVVKNPDANTALRMTIWNKTTASVLKSVTINYTTAGVEITTAIDPINVTAGTEYFVTFNSNDWYDRRRNNGTNTTYPITVGDVSITSYSFASGTAQVMPDSPQLSYYAGDISFKFQKS